MLRDFLNQHGDTFNIIPPHEFIREYKSFEMGLHELEGLTADINPVHNPIKIVRGGMQLMTRGKSRRLLSGLNSIHHKKISLVIIKPADFNINYTGTDTITHAIQQNPAPRIR